MLTKIKNHPHSTLFLSSRDWFQLEGYRETNATCLCLNDIKDENDIKQIRQVFINTDFGNIIIDGYIVENIYYPFDLLFHNGKQLNIDYLWTSDEEDKGRLIELQNLVQTFSSAKASKGIIIKKPLGNYSPGGSIFRENVRVSPFIGPIDPYESLLTFVKSHRRKDNDILFVPQNGSGKYMIWRHFIPNEPIVVQLLREEIKTSGPGYWSLGLIEQTPEGISKNWKLFKTPINLNKIKDANNIANDKNKNNFKDLENNIHRLEGEIFNNATIINNLNYQIRRKDFDFNQLQQNSQNHIQEIQRLQQEIQQLQQQLQQLQHQAGFAQPPQLVNHGAQPVYIQQPQPHGRHQQQQQQPNLVYLTIGQPALKDMMDTIIHDSINSYNLIISDNFHIKDNDILSELNSAYKKQEKEIEKVYKNIVTLFDSAEDKFKNEELADNNKYKKENQLSCFSREQKNDIIRNKHNINCDVYCFEHGDVAHATKIEMYDSQELNIKVYCCELHEVDIDTDKSLFKARTIIEYDKIYETKTFLFFILNKI